MAKTQTKRDKALKKIEKAERQSEKDIKQLHEETAADIIAVIAAIIATYGTEGKITVSQLTDTRYGRKPADLMEESIRRVCLNSIPQEEYIVTDTGKRTINTISEDLYDKETDDETMQRILLAALLIGGLSIHERLVLRKEAIINTLIQKIMSAFVRGENPVTIYSKIKSFYIKRAGYDVRRILYTSDTLFAAKTDEFYSGDEFYMYKTAGDSKVCPDCKILEGKVFAYKDAIVGVNFPPLHPFCRCQAIPVKRDT